MRLDPKLNYLCELAARAQRRTKSSFIEWAIDDSLGHVTLPDVRTFGDDFGSERDVTIKEKVMQLWHVDEPDRVVALALIAPALLTHEEQLIWKILRECGYLWRGKYAGPEDEWTWVVEEERLLRDRLRDKWEIFKAVAAGDRPKTDLPTWNKSRPAPPQIALPAPRPQPKSFDADLDDDVPF